MDKSLWLNKLLLLLVSGGICLVLTWQLHPTLSWGSGKDYPNLPIDKQLQAEQQQDEAFKWHDCYDGKFKCGTLDVPLNHLNRTNNHSSLNVALIKYPASQQPSLGSILINPGGPGGSGIDSVLIGAELLTIFTGNRYDLIGFDPRGIGKSGAVRCFSSPSNHGVYTLTHSIRGQPEIMNAAAAGLAASCGIHSKNYLEYISTAYTARDMDLIREALGENVTNFWGFSYGTALGITYANLFPDRVGRFIMDGMTDPNFSGDYLDYAKSSTRDTDLAFDSFAKECELAGPNFCALAKTAVATTNSSNSSNSPNSLNSPNPGKGLARVIRDFVQELNDDPIPVVDEGGDNANIVKAFTGVHLSELIFETMYYASAWPDLAKAIHELLPPTSNASLALKMIPSTAAESPGSLCPMADTSDGVAFSAIKCNDGDHDIDTKHTLKEWKQAADDAAKISFLAGRAWTYSGLACRYWPVKPVERYAGPWNRKPLNKVLIVSNTVDPATPLANAKVAMKEMEGNGVLLIQEAYGHCSLSFPSMCLIQKLQAFWQEGVYPDVGEVCKRERGPFDAYVGSLTGNTSSLIDGRLRDFQKFLSQVNNPAF